MEDVSPFENSNLAILAICLSRHLRGLRTGHSLWQNRGQAAGRAGGRNFRDAINSCL